MHNNAIVAILIQEVPNDMQGSIADVILQGLGTLGEYLNRIPADFRVKSRIC